MKKCSVCKLSNTGTGSKHWHCNPFVEGYVEIRNGKPYLGRVGLKVWRFKKDILAEGFESEEVRKVRVSVI